MDIIRNISHTIDNPVVIWEQKNKELYCNYYNQKFIEEFKLNNITDEHIKDIYPFFSKKYYKYYKKCIKDNTDLSYNFFYQGNKIISNILYIKPNFIFEKINIIKIHDNDLLNDPFNMVIIIGNKYKICNVNFVFLRNSEYNIKDVINKNIRDVLTNSINFNYGQITNNNIITKNKKLLNVDVYKHKLDNDHDIIIMKDIKTIKENIINSKVIKSLDAAIIIFDKNNQYFESYKCINTNKSFIDIFGDDTIIDKNIIEIFDEETYYKVKKAYLSMQMINSYTIKDVIYNNKYYDLNCFIIEDQIFGIIINDITSSIEIQNINNSKNNFLTNIIDKLRKPIYGIFSTLNILGETKLNLEQREYINKTLEYSHILSILINDFTDYANIELNKLKMEKESFNIREELDQYYENFLLKTNEKNIELIFKIDNIPPYIVSDKYRFRQILYNVLNNAIKFTETGKIELKIYSKTLSSNKYNLFIEVNDTGIGIQEQYLDKIFESFYQIDNHKNSGSGLGLSLCKSLCELLNGEIRVESTFGKGSTFFVTLLVEEFTNIDEIEEKSFDILKDKKILIIDENSQNRISISKILMRWKMYPHMASTSDEVLFLIDNNRFDTCFIDIDSSNMYGCELAKKIKSYNKFIPIIAMSAFEDRKYNKNVFNYLILKPINKSKILKLFINIFSDIDIQTKKKSTDDIQIYNNLPILLSIDSNNSTMINTIHKLGYTNTNILHNNQEIISKLYSNEYSLLLIDIEKIDDINIIKKIKTIKNHPYIIAMIPFDDKKIKKKCEKYKIDAHIAKPIDIHELKALLRVISRRIN